MYIYYINRCNLRYKKKTKKDNKKNNKKIRKNKIYM